MRLTQGKRRLRRALQTFGVWLGLCMACGVWAQEPRRAFNEDEEAQTQFQRGVSLYQQTQYAAALEALEPVVVRHPDQAAAYRLIGLCRLEMKDYAAAAAALRKAVELTRAQENREDAAARLALGKALFLSGDFPGAAAELTFAAARPEADAATWTLLGYAHYRAGDESAARKALLQATARDERRTEAWRLLAELDVAAATTTPDDATAVKRALAGIEKLQRLEPAVAAGLRGRLFVAQRQFAKAIPELDRALPQQPDDAALVFALGLALSREKQLDRAATVLRKATTLLPDEAGVWRELGYVYERAGRRTDAVAAYEKAAALGGPDDFITRALERLKAPDGDAVEKNPL